MDEKQISIVRVVYRVFADEDHEAITLGLCVSGREKELAEKLAGRPERLMSYRIIRELKVNDSMDRVL